MYPSRTPKIVSRIRHLISSRRASKGHYYRRTCRPISVHFLLFSLWISRSVFTERGMILIEFTQVSVPDSDKYGFSTILVTIEFCGGGEGDGEYWLHSFIDECGMYHGGLVLLLPSVPFSPGTGVCNATSYKLSIYVCITQGLHVVLLRVEFI